MTDWCFSGPLSNWYYGLERAVWATNNEHNHLNWFNEMTRGDNVIIYITEGIGVAGYCKIAGKSKKQEPWWPDEVKEESNLYPNVIYINDVFLAADIENRTELRELSLNEQKWRACGLTQRHIIGGVNVLRDAQIFERLKNELQYKGNGTLSVRYASDKEPTDIVVVREKITSYIVDDKPRASGDAEDLDLDDIAPNAAPERIETVVQLWRRNRWIIEERRRETNNRCEIPGCDYVPFEKPSRDRYSEGHHMIPLGEPGSDSLQNIAILCPNHHREIHYGVQREELTNILKKKRKLS